MRANPARWLWGLIPIGMLTWICFQWEAPRIEADLTRRAAVALRQSGQGWATPTFSGRDAVLSGLAADGSGPKTARETVRALWGVRDVDLRTDLAERRESYVWSAAFGGGKLTLQGFVPSEEARKSVVTLARQRFPKIVIEDAMVISPRTSAGSDRQSELWLDSVRFGLAQLSILKRGVVNLDGGALAVSGQAADPATYNAVRQALAGEMPEGVKLARSDIAAPVVSPFTWSASLAGRQLTLTGYAPSDAAREEVFARAKRLFPRVAIVDRSETAAGAPSGWMDAARLSLDVLATLGGGAAELKDQDLTLSGTGADKAATAAAHNLLAQRASGAFRISDAIGRQRTSPSPAGEDATSAVPSSEAERQAAIDADTRSRAEAYAASRRAAEAKASGDRSADVAAYAAARREAEAITAQRAKERDDGYAAARRAIEAEAANAEAARTVTARSAEEARLRDAGFAAARRQADAQAAASARATNELDAKAVAEAHLRDAGYAAARRRAETQARPIPSPPTGSGVASERDDGYAALRRRIEAAAAATRRAAKGTVAAVNTAIRPKLSAEEQSCQDRLTAANKSGTILFETGSAEIKRASRPALDKLAAIANACPTVRIEIEGHTDSQGEAGKNRLLSERRAEAVKTYLAKDGVSADRLSAVGYGADRPVAPNDSDQNRARNRRIEFTVLAR